MSVENDRYFSKLDKKIGVSYEPDYDAIRERNNSRRSVVKSIQKEIEEEELKPNPDQDKIRKLNRDFENATCD